MDDGISASERVDLEALSLNKSLDTAQLSESSESIPHPITVKTLFYQDRSDCNLISRLQEQRVISSEQIVSPALPASDSIAQIAEVPYVIRSHENPLGARVMDPETKKFNELDHLLPTGDGAPKTVVIDIPSQIAFRGNHAAYQRMYVDYLTKYDIDQQPTVVMYSEDQELPLDAKHSYQGFLFASTPDELKHALEFGDKFASLSQKPSEFRPEGLAPKQEEQYDASLDLRDWEQRTADTYQSLKHILERINIRNTMYQKDVKERYRFPFKETPRDPMLPKRPIQSILDLGTGEGRIGGMMARLGFNVMGLDISNELLDRSKARLREEGAGLRGEVDDSTLSYPALQTLQNEGIAGEAILSDTETAKHFLPVQGDFFHLHTSLHDAVKNWETRYPDVDKYKFFNANRGDDYAFADERDMFTDIGFDMVLLNWNTFNHIGDPENQKKVLSQLQNVMWPGAEVVIEIPKPDQEPYVSAIETYHTEHPNTPKGTVVDPLPNGEGTYAPRYFPTETELLTLLKNVGFEIDAARDVQSYEIEGKKQSDGSVDPTLSELFITARKSRS